MEDGRCKLGVAGRLELVRRIEACASMRQAAACLGVAPATAHRWWGRWRAADDEQRSSLACLRARPPRPRSCPSALEVAVEQRMHIDAMQLAKFERPGHWATGRGYQRSRGAGRVSVVAVVDDQSRLAYAELHSRETAATVAATLRRAERWMREQGCGPVEAVMSDNHKAYTSHRFKALLAELGARHIPTPPYTPRWNGKLERFNQTLAVEWARSRICPESPTRDRALSSFLRYYG